MPLPVLLGPHRNPDCPPGHYSTGILAPVEQEREQEELQGLASLSQVAFRGDILPWLKKTTNFERAYLFVARSVGCLCPYLGHFLVDFKNSKT